MYYVLICDREITFLTDPEHIKIVPFDNGEDALDYAVNHPAYITTIVKG